MQEKDEFVEYLESIKDDRGKLAALRRGLGQPPGSCPAMYPVVASRLPRDCPPRLEEKYYLLAALFGFHPLSSQAGNMGDHMRLACGGKPVEAVERRFARLLASHVEDLPDALRQVVSFLKSKDQHINWHQLSLDLSGWGSPLRYVQRRWANAFWGIETENSDENQ